MAKHPLKAIVWDAGLVMFFWPKGQDWDHHWSKVPRVRSFFDRCNLTNAMEAIVAVQRRLEIGELDTKGHRLALSKVFELETPLTWAEYTLAYLNGVDFTLNKPLLEVQGNIVRDRVIQQGLISNLCPIMRDVLSKAGVFNSLNPRLFSCEEELMKPSKELLVRALDRLGCAAEETLVVDDNADNIAMAGRDDIRCRTHLYKDNPRLAQCLLENGVPPIVVSPFLQGEARTPLQIDWQSPR